MDTQEIKEQLKNFLDQDGRLTKYPARHKYKMLSLLYLSTKFEPNRKYTEKEINEQLKSWHTFEDWAMLRRDMYDKGFFDRENDGSVYWLGTQQPLLADLGFQ